MVRDRREGRRALQGVVILIAVLALAFSATRLASLLRGRREAYSLIGLVPQAARIQPGTYVLVAGVRAGRTIRIRPDGPGADPTERFVVELRVDRAVWPVIRADSRLRIVRPGPFGQPTLEIEPGSAASPPVQPGDTIRTRPPVAAGQLASEAKALLAEGDSLAAEFRPVSAEATAAAARFEAWLQLADVARAEFDAFAESLRAGDAANWSAGAEPLKAAIARLGEVVDSLDARRGQILDGTPGLPHLHRLRQELDSLRTLLVDPNATVLRATGDSAILRAIDAIRHAVDSTMAQSRRDPLRFLRRQPN